MKEKIAVATVSGKAYYLIVKELKKRNLSFLSLRPGEPIPIEVEVVLTTEAERQSVQHERVLTCKDEIELELLVSRAICILQGKENYERLVIGVDPGEVFGVAVLADGKIIETENCLSIEETVAKIEKILRNFSNTQIGSISVKIGDGVPACKERLMQLLDQTLSPNVTLESVREAGTNRNFSEIKQRRGLRDIVSAINIAGRNGYSFQRRRTDESNGWKKQNALN